MVTGIENKDSFIIKGKVQSLFFQILQKIIFPFRKRLFLWCVS
jgi:hypothetical protein